jgi:cyclopropane fatty-acyl-phospholipid synthase-like methyltransferase
MTVRVVMYICETHCSLDVIPLIGGNDFYNWFLGPRMIYTCGIVTDITREETLEELQDNKLRIVCEKLNLQPGDTLLDIGCGWGTLVAFAAKNYGVKALGVTLAKEQAAFGNQRIKDNGLTSDQAEVLCCDYRDIPRDRKFTKIVSLEMAEVLPNPLVVFRLELTPTSVACWRSSL